MVAFSLSLLGWFANYGEKTGRTEEKRRREEKNTKGERREGTTLANWEQRKAISLLWNIAQDLRSRARQYSVSLKGFLGEIGQGLTVDFLHSEDTLLLVIKAYALRNQVLDQLLNCKLLKGCSGHQGC